MHDHSWSESEDSLKIHQSSTACARSRQKDKKRGRAVIMDAAEESNKNNFERTGRTLDKPMIFELILRGGGVILAVSCIITSSVCLHKLSAAQNSQNLIVPNTRAAAGWILFLSLVACMYQVFTIFQLFSYVKLLYVKIPVGKSLWYLFPLMDLVINIMFIIGYLCAAIAMAVYSFAPNILVPVAAVVFTCLLAFSCAARSVGNVIFILLAKIKFKWPNYFIPENSESLISSTVCAQTDDSKT